MRRLLIVLAVSLGLSGCFGGGLTPVTPETPRESLVASEAAYEFALLEVKSLILSGYIKPGTQLATNVRLIIVETRAALDAWQLNPDSPNLARAAQAVLNRLQAQVAAMIKTQGASYKADPVGEKTTFVEVMA